MRDSSRLRSRTSMHQRLNSTHPPAYPRFTKLRTAHSMKKRYPRAQESLNFVPATSAQRHEKKQSWNLYSCFRLPRWILSRIEAPETATCNVPSAAPGPAAGPSSRWKLRSTCRSPAAAAAKAWASCRGRHSCTTVTRGGSRFNLGIDLQRLRSIADP